jgi:hypothetical protein
MWFELINTLKLADSIHLLLTTPKLQFHQLVFYFEEINNIHFVLFWVAWN